MKLGRSPRIDPGATVPGSIHAWTGADVSPNVAGSAAVIDVLSSYGTLTAWLRRRVSNA
jgi:hypothetical protein